MATIVVSPARVGVILCLTVLSAGLLALDAMVAVGFAGTSEVFAIVVALLAVLAAGSGLAAVANIRRHRSCPEC